MAIETINIGNDIPNTDTLRDGFDKVNSNTTELDTNKVPYNGARSDVDLGEFQLKVGQIELDQSPTGTAGVAKMRWNNTDGTFDIGLKGGNVTLQVGQEQVVRVVNKTGATLLEANYQAVKVSGATGQRLSVVLAQADNDSNSATTLGIATETINDNLEGFITINGEVREINTTGSLQGETWSDGDILYLSATTAGQLTNIKPIAPEHLIVIGFVVYAHANHGKIFVKVDNGYELDELHNVLISTPTNDQVLQFESATSLWKNKTLATGITVGTTAVTSGTNGRIFFQNGGVMQQSANFVWDNTNSRLGIAQVTPGARLDILAQGALSTDLALRIRNSANTADIFNITGNGWTILQALKATDSITIQQPSGSYYPNLTFIANGSSTCGQFQGYNGGMMLQSATYFHIAPATHIASGVGSMPASAILSATSTTKGFLPPRMTNAQRTAIASPAVGLIVYCTDTVEGLYIYKSTGWTFII